MQDSSNMRSGTRSLVVFELTARHATSGDSLGLLVDVSPNGLCLMSSEAMTIGETIPLVIDSCPTDDSLITLASPIRGTARVRWCKSNENHPDICVVGLEIEEFASPQAEKAYQELIELECIDVSSPTAFTSVNAGNEQED